MTFARIMAAFATAVLMIALPETAGAIDDTTPPEVADFSFSPEAVDTSSGEQFITFTARFIDSPAGLQQAEARFRSPSGNQFLNALFYDEYLVSGTPQDGTYSYQASLPQFSEQGVWTLEWFLVQDLVGNSEFIDESVISGLGFPTTFTNGGVGDTTIPTVADFDFSPSTVDTSSGGQIITFTARFIDSPAGLQQAEARFRSPSGNQFLNALFYDEYLVSGTPQDGTYSYQATIPQFSEQGEWQLEWFYVNDLVGNSEFIDESVISGLGFPTTFTNRAVPDTDEDGIRDDVDEAPSSVSTRFSDMANGGATAGQIVAVPAGLDVAVFDVLSGGVRITVSGSNGQVEIAIDGKESVFRFQAGSYVLTDPTNSTTVSTDSGGPATVVLPFLPPVTITIPSGSTAVITETTSSAGVLLSAVVEATEGNVLIDSATLEEGDEIGVDDAPSTPPNPTNTPSPTQEPQEDSNATLAPTQPTATVIPVLIPSITPTPIVPRTVPTPSPHVNQIIPPSTGDGGIQ